MNLKCHRPINSSTRGLVDIDRRGLWKGGPYKPLITRIPKTGGRNNLGRVTAWHIGGGHPGPKACRMIAKRVPGDGVAKVERIEYDPGRSAFIALVDCGSEKRYMIAPENVRPGDEIGGTEIRVGSCLALKDIPSGTRVHNIEMRPGSGARVVRSAGTFAQILGVDGETASVRLPSGQIKKFLQNCAATVGVVSNASHMNRQYAKAGRIRWMGCRPIVRGTAMNAHDHPHGGGRGKSKGHHPVTPWGINTKGFKTRKKSKGRL